MFLATRAKPKQFGGFSAKINFSNWQQSKCLSSSVLISNHRVACCYAKLTSYTCEVGCLFVLVQKFECVAMIAIKRYASLMCLYCFVVPISQRRTLFRTRSHGFVAGHSFATMPSMR